MVAVSQSPDKGLRNYTVITLGYWGFTVTDGAIRILVLTYFHLLGYSPFEVAMLFLFYEFFGVITNLVGGWLGARIGLNRTMHIGMGLQVVALLSLTVPDQWLSVPYVMAAQALSGIAKDLNKMSAKASIKTLVSGDTESRLFKWVAVLTGSKNALKGAGFFVGVLLLQWLGFRGALAALAAALGAVLVITLVMLPTEIGKMQSKPKFTQVFSNSPAVNWLSGARFFLFGARDVWFVVALPVFLYEVLSWSFTQTGGFLALWIIGYGAIQASTPPLLQKLRSGADGRTAMLAAFILSAIPAAIALSIDGSDWVAPVLIAGLALFGIAFAINSALHSFLILSFSDSDRVSLNVGFYYMSNAGGRLAGTVLSGAVYQYSGLSGALWASCVMLVVTGLISLKIR